MNFRHAAALTLMVWYLMMPPNLAQTSWSCSGGFTGRIFHAWIGSQKRVADCTSWRKIADFDTPFSQWSSIGAFHMYEACETQLAKNLASEPKAVFPGPPSMQERCVADIDLGVN